MSTSTRGLIGIRAEDLNITGRCGGSSCSAKAVLRTKLVGTLHNGASLDQDFVVSEDLWKINWAQICWTMEALLKELVEKVQMKTVEQVEQKIISAAQDKEAPTVGSK